jgi:ubiquitin carboxyl-terminal hydrolase 48
VERKSRRARKNRQPLKVCSSDSLAQLRLKVFEALIVHPKNQQLYMRGSLMQGEDSTLAQVRATAGCASRQCYMT